MPDYAAHYYFGQSVLENLPKQIVNNINIRIFDFALSGPDDWALYRFWIPSLRKGKNERASEMHTTNTGAFLSEISKEPALFSYAAGFLCHYAFDSICHPYVIACAGTYKDTAETKVYRGNHAAFEHAIDRYMLKQHHNAEPHPISKKMQGKHLPKDLRPIIDRVYKDIFDWDNAFRDIHRSKRDLKLFLWLMEDPNGIIRFFTKPFHHPTMNALLYSRAYYVNEDIYNLKHRIWHHPNDPLLASSESFEELIDKAVQRAVCLITDIFNQDFSRIGNVSYMTGFELSDPRNHAPESYCPLNRYS